jgi:hypothetical protein
VNFPGSRALEMANEAGPLGRKVVLVWQIASPRNALEARSYETVRSMRSATDDIASMPTPTSNAEWRGIALSAASQQRFACAICLLNYDRAGAAR